MNGLGLYGIRGNLSSVSVTVGWDESSAASQCWVGGTFLTLTNDLASFLP